MSARCWRPDVKPSNVAVPSGTRVCCLKIYIPVSYEFILVGVVFRLGLLALVVVLCDCEAAEFLGFELMFSTLSCVLQDFPE